MYAYTYVSGEVSDPEHLLGVHETLVPAPRRRVRVCGRPSDRQRLHAEAASLAYGVTRAGEWGRGVGEGGANKFPAAEYLMCDRDLVLIIERGKLPREKKATTVAVGWTLRFDWASQKQAWPNVSRTGPDRTEAHRTEQTVKGHV